MRLRLPEQTLHARFVFRIAVLEPAESCRDRLGGAGLPQSEVVAAERRVEPRHAEGVEVVFLLDPLHRPVEVCGFEHRLAILPRHAPFRVLCPAERREAVLVQRRQIDILQPFPVFTRPGVVVGVHVGETDVEERAHGHRVREIEIEHLHGKRHGALHRLTADARINPQSTFVDAGLRSLRRLRPHPERLVLAGLHRNAAILLRRQRVGDRPAQADAVGRRLDLDVPDAPHLDLKPIRKAFRRDFCICDIPCGRKHELHRLGLVAGRAQHQTFGGRLRRRQRLARHFPST